MFSIRPAARCLAMPVAASCAPARALHTVSPVCAPVAPCVSSSGPRSLLGVAQAAGFSRRLQRLANDLPKHARAQFDDKKQGWNKAKLSARDVARFRKADLLSGGTFSEFETARLRRVEPTVLKGHKREAVVLARKARIVEAMKDMEERVEEHWKAERARRVRPTFYQQITGKKPSGVIAAEEAALKERKEKNKEREKARQAAMNAPK